MFQLQKKGDLLTKHVGNVKFQNFLKYMDLIRPHLRRNHVSLTKPPHLLSKISKIRVLKALEVLGNTKLHILLYEILSYFFSTHYKNILAYQV